MANEKTALRPTSNAEMAGHLNRQKATVNRTTSFQEQLGAWFKQNGRRIESLCGSMDEARRLFAAALNAITKVPTLLECPFESILKCLLTSAEFRLYPGAAMECAYVPFKNHGQYEATFMLMYPGTCQLLYRSGMVKDIEAEIVCEKDYFKLIRGSERRLEFEPCDAALEDRGEWLGVYCIIRNVYGGTHIAYLTSKEVMAIKARSRASESDFSPWNSKFAGDAAWMWRKTALKQAAKLAPRSVTASGLVAAALAATEGEEGSGAHGDAGGKVFSGARTEVGPSEPPPALDPPREGISVGDLMREKVESQNI